MDERDVDSQAPGGVMRGRTPLVIVAGLDRGVVDRVADGLAAPKTVVVSYDLGALAQNTVIRTVRRIGDATLAGTAHTDWVELDHGCVSCTLRDDLLPLLRRLSRRDGVDRIVLALDAAIEPEPLCWAIDTHDVVGLVGHADGPAARDVVVHSVVGCLDAGRWLTCATGDVTLAEAGFVDGGADDETADERTLAQIAVGHAEFADALVVHSIGEVDRWESARLFAVLKRLNPRAPIVLELPERRLQRPIVEHLIDSIGPDSRRGAIYGVHDRLLRGQPPLDVDCGVELIEFVAQRPFHPERLHEAIDVLLDGVVATRGRLWLATQPDEALWLESAGGGLRVATGGPWLAAMTEDERAHIDPERAVLAAAHWDPRFGDRHSYLVVLSHRGDTVTIREQLGLAVLTDAEFTAGPGAWADLPDPFGQFHEDPCDDLPDGVGSGQEGDSHTGVDRRG